jgi:hypothetical protein
VGIVTGGSYCVICALKSEQTMILKKGGKDKLLHILYAMSLQSLLHVSDEWQA